MMHNIFQIETVALAHRACMACDSGVSFTEIFRVLRRAGLSEFLFLEVITMGASLMVNKDVWPMASR